MTDACPVCGGDRSRPAAGDAPFRRCRTCCAVFNTAHAPLSYSDSYFTSDYKAQYGKTYEEDFAPIYRASKLRLERILKLRRGFTPEKPRSLLDIGCALGFFLKAAEDDGFSELKGIEISQYASEYAKKRFGYEIEQKPFNADALSGSFDAVTAWYFLEHLPDTKSAIDAIYAALAPDGVAAFSLPSYFGPLYMFRRSEWVNTHPADHRIDLSPKSAVRALRHAGFRRVRVYPSGIHPERVMKPSSPLYPLFARAYRFFSRLTAFSDTIEVYALK